MDARAAAASGATGSRGAACTGFIVAGGPRYNSKCGMGRKSVFAQPMGRLRARASAAGGTTGRWYTQESFSRQTIFEAMRNQAGSPGRLVNRVSGEHPGFVRSRPGAFLQMDAPMTRVTLKGRANRLDVCPTFARARAVSWEAT